MVTAPSTPAPGCSAASFGISGDSRLQATQATASASLFGRSWLSDKAAARCYGATVGLGRRLQGAAEFLVVETFSEAIFGITTQDHLNSHSLKLHPRLPSALRG
jgi:hypothetical protein